MSMMDKSVLRGVVSVIVLIMVSSFTIDAPVRKYSPVGSWDYSVPGVEEGYESGIMLISEDGKEYKVTLQLNEYSKVVAEKVVYKKKEISYTIYVETEEILISGTFDGDNFSGKLSYFEGDFNITANRKAE
jgi:hypothetical protein